MEEINYKKSLGQNFLYDTNLLKAIVADGDVEPTDTVLEIGAGAGTLTAQLANTAKKVIAFEIDKNLIPILDKVKAEHNNIDFRFMDFMEYDLNELSEKDVRVVANIPYYITTPIIFKLVEHIQKFKSILVLIQKEVALRFSAEPKSKDYGITSVILQSIFDVSMPRVIKKECFTPSPKIDSALCKLVPHNKYQIKDFAGFKDFVKLSFSMRRKTLVNNLKTKYDKAKIEDALTKFGYSVSARPEELSVSDFLSIFTNLNN